MTLPASGAISFNNINVELGVAGTTQASLGQASYRSLAGVASGAISMSNFWGKSNTFSFTISADTTNADLRTLAISAGWNQTAKLYATINSGVVVSANGTGTPGLTISGSFPNGVYLTNNGYIIGMGGKGGAGGGNTAYYPYTNAGQSGFSGGTALSVATAVNITNNGTIGGGGGGGGGAGQSNVTSYGGGYLCGSGGGGGRTGRTNSAGGAAGQGYGNGYAGSAGTFSSAGAGGPMQPPPVTTTNSTVGATGGGWGSAGGTAPGTGSWTGGSGGAGGAAVTGNSNITWATTGTRYGSIS